MPVPLSSSQAAHCINPHCPHPYPHPWSDRQCRHCGTSLRLNDRYIPMQRLIIGHSVHLYLVYDPETRAEKLMRVLVAITPKAQTIFEREVMALSSLHHRGLPKIEAPAYFHIDIRQPTVRSLPCLIFEKVEGSSLQDIAAKYPQGCPEAWVMNWFRQAVLILQKLHSRRLLHRDLKPSSLVLRQGTQQLAIADIGFPKPLVAEESTQPLSAGYCPSEQGQEEVIESIGPHADFYALGRICIHLLTGRHPLTLENDAGELKWQHRVRIHPAFANLLDHLVNQDVGLRLHTATDILEELNHFSVAPTSPLPRLSPPPDSAPNSSGTSVKSSSQGRSAVRSGRSPLIGGTTGGLVATARTATPSKSTSKSKPKSKSRSYTSGSSGGSYSRGDELSGGSRTRMLPTARDSGRYREDPHPQNLMNHRLEAEREQPWITDAIAWMDQAREWFVQVCVLLFQAMVYACIGSVIATGVGFWITYWSPLSPSLAVFFNHQLTSPQMPLVVKPAMIVFTFAGVGTAWGLTQTQNLEMQKLLWRQRAMSGLIYAIAWLTWQWGIIGTSGSVGIIRCTAAMAVGLVIALQVRGNLLIQTMITTLGTSLTFATVMHLGLWKPGNLLYLFQTTSNFIPTDAVCGAAIIFFGLSSLVLSFWLGFSYYVGLPGLAQLSRRIRGY